MEINQKMNIITNISSRKMSKQRILLMLIFMILNFIKIFKIKVLNNMNILSRHFYV